MYRFTAFFLVLSFCTMLLAQNQPKLNNKNSGFQTVKEDTASKIPQGYGEIAWGTYLSDALEKIKGKLSYTDKKKIIISKDGYLTYHYGFFYPDPAMTKEDRFLREYNSDKNTNGDNDGTASEEKEYKDEGKLFYVSLKFPYLSEKTVFEKIKAKYGKPSRENIKKNRGAYVWESDKTLLVMWVDDYEKKPFCGRIIFMSREIAKNLNKYTHDMFYKKELELIKTLKP